MPKYVLYSVMRGDLSFQGEFDTLPECFSAIAEQFVVPVGKLRQEPANGGNIELWLGNTRLAVIEIEESET